MLSLLSMSVLNEGHPGNESIEFYLMSMFLLYYHSFFLIKYYFKTFVLNLFASMTRTFVNSFKTDYFGNTIIAPYLVMSIRHTHSLKDFFRTCNLTWSTIFTKSSNGSHQIRTIIDAIIYCFILMHFPCFNKLHLFCWCVICLIHNSLNWQTIRGNLLMNQNHLNVVSTEDLHTHKLSYDLSS